MDLTSNPNAETLEEVEIQGRTVYVSKRTESAFIEFKDELVSLTNLNAWNHLMEEGKKQVIDDYNTEKSREEKQLDKQKAAAADRVAEFRRELREIEADLRE